MTENKLAVMTEILQNRRSIRKFTERQLTAAEQDCLQKAVLLAPTSRDLQPCEFFWLTDGEKIKQLAAVKGGGTTLDISSPATAASPSLTPTFRPTLWKRPRR